MSYTNQSKPNRVLLICGDFMVKVIVATTVLFAVILAYLGWIIWDNLEDRERASLQNDILATKTAESRDRPGMFTPLDDVSGRADGDVAKDLQSSPTERTPGFQRSRPD